MGNIASGDLTAAALRLNELCAAASPGERIAHLRREVSGKIVFTTSFGLEDQAILELIAGHDLEIDVVTLDTGRLFAETYDLWARTERQYGRRIRAIYPREDELERLVERIGINGFYESREARRNCCHVRKVEPLARALAGSRGWITGLRADQSLERQAMGLVEADGARGLVKLNPFFDWSRDDVLAFARERGVPLNPLHARGFHSIGCAPCTRAVRPDEPERDGRWWWENDGNKECGLHLVAARPVRSTIGQGDEP